MTRDEFIAGYCERSGITWAKLSEFSVAVPCDCGYPSCAGWAMISNRPEAIADHMRLYAPGDEFDLP